MPPLLIKLLVAAVAGYALLLVLVFLFQRQLQYQPGHRNPAPEAAGLAGVSVVTLRTDDGESLILWHRAAEPGRPTILFFHGNAGEIGDRAPRFAFYAAQGFGVAFLSYRGYGGSSGTPSEPGLVADAQAAYDWLLTQGIPPERILLAGESLGSAVAVQLSARNGVAAVALDAPFSAAVDVAAARFPFLPVGWLMRDQFRSADLVAAIHAPLLIQHGTADRVVSYRFGQKLFAAAVQPKTFMPLPDRGHEAIFEADAWQREVEFFNQIVK